MQVKYLSSNLEELIFIRLTDFHNFESDKEFKKITLVYIVTYNVNDDLSSVDGRGHNGEGGQGQGVVVQHAAHLVQRLAPAEA